MKSNSVRSTDIGGLFHYYMVSNYALMKCFGFVISQISKYKMEMFSNI